MIRRGPQADQRRVEIVLLTSLLAVLMVGGALWWVSQEPQRVALLPESRGPGTIVVTHPTGEAPSPLALGDAMVAPSGNLDRPASGSAFVVDVATPRGFWAEAAGRRFFVLLSRSVDSVEGLAVGETVVISGIVKAPAAIGDVEELDEGDRSAIQGLDALVLATHVKIPSRRSPR